MKTKLVETVTNNEDYARMRIFDGDLEISDASAELIRLAQAQLKHERERHSETKAKLHALRVKMWELTGSAV